MKKRKKHITKVKAMAKPLKPKKRVSLRKINRIYEERIYEQEKTLLANVKFVRRLVREHSKEPDYIG